MQQYKLWLNETIIWIGYNKNNNRESEIVDISVFLTLLKHIKCDGAKNIYRIWNKNGNKMEGEGKKLWAGWDIETQTLFPCLQKTKD